MSEENVNLVRRYVEDVVGKGDAGAIEEIYSPDYVNHTTFAGGDLRGLDGVRSVMTAFRTGFPDVNVTIDDVIEAGDKVVTRATGYGTHTGEFRGIAPTGRKIEVRIISIFRISEGKIIERWENMDTMTLMQQIGAIPG